MDFGVMAMDGSLVAQQGTCNKTGHPAEVSNHKSHGSGFLKQERSESTEESWRLNKAPRLDEFDASCKPVSQQSLCPSLLGSASLVSGNDGQTMLSFSTAKPDVETARSLSFPLFQAHQAQGPLFGRTSDYAYGGSNEGLRGPFTRFRGPFTPSQWMELEHQALIYKHIEQNVPVPSYLLIPLKKSLNPYILSSGSYASNSWGWGTFHLGFSGNNDPEPGRCRRTDGKKWRCSRDAVPDQKYCERHINRGRHRSRKPVEGQTGHAVAGSTTSKVAPIASSSSALVMSSSGTSNSHGAAQHQLSLQPSAAKPSTNNIINRVHDPKGILVKSPAISFKSHDPLVSVQTRHDPLGESSQSEFGLVSSDSLLNPSQSSYIDSKDSNSFLGFSDQQRRDQLPLRHFIDDWPKDQSDRATDSWPDELKSDWTQLSMSIPMASSDFSSSSDSPRQEKLTHSPAKFSRESDPIPVGLRAKNNASDPIQKQANWFPVSWGSSMGGPLGEVLNRTSGNTGAGKNPSALNLMTEVWDTNSQLGSSPTGVLQKSTFVSLSNSSSGSSPRADNKNAPEGTSTCNDMLGPTITNSSIPSM